MRKEVFFFTSLMVDNVNWYFDTTVSWVDTEHLKKCLSSRARGQGKRRVYLRHFRTYILPLHLVFSLLPTITGNLLTPFLSVFILIKTPQSLPPRLAVGMFKEGNLKNTNSPSQHSSRTLM